MKTTKTSFYAGIITCMALFAQSCNTEPVIENPEDPVIVADYHPAVADSLKLQYQILGALINGDGNIPKLIEYTGKAGSYTFFYKKELDIDNCTDNELFYKCTTDELDGTLVYEYERYGVDKDGYTMTFYKPKDKNKAIDIKNPSTYSVSEFVNLFTNRAKTQVSFKTLHAATGRVVAVNYRLVPTASAPYAHYFYDGNDVDVDGSLIEPNSLTELRSNVKVTMENIGKSNK